MSLVTLRYFWCVVIFFLLGDVNYKVWHNMVTFALETSLEKFPFHAAIHGRIICSGILISDQYIICPAHCVNDTTDETKIVLGNQNDAYFSSSDRHWKAGTKIHHCHEIIIHERFIRTSRKVYLNNIALVKLPDKVALSKNIQPALLVSKEDYQQLIIGDETLVNVTGWYTDIVTNLSMSTEQLLNKDFCSYLYGHQHFFRGQELCLQWKGISESRLNLFGNPVSFNNKVLGYITKSPCYPHHEFNNCKDYNKILVIPPFLEWISRKTNIAIDKLTGVSNEPSKTILIEKLNRLGYLTQDIKNQNLENMVRMHRLEAKLEEVYDLLKGINASIENSCIGWNE